MCATGHRPPAYAERVSHRTLGWVLVGVQALLLLALVLLPRRSPSPASAVVGCALVAVAIALGWSAFRALGRALTPTPVPIPGAGLRTDGPYRLVRHPIYSAILLAGTGFAVAIGTWWTVAALGVLGLFFLAKSRWEDRLLRAQYGAAWEEWASTTGALLPRPPR